MSNAPDYHIEQFWLTFKVSMNNYYNTQTVKRPINFWSAELNNLQDFKQYDQIENKIRNIISLYAIDLMKSNNTYNTDILLTNIKRWNKIALKYNFEKSTNIYHNIIFLLLDIYKNIMYDLTIELKNIFSQIELFIIYQDFSSLIEYSINYKKESILDKLNQYTNFTNVNKYIENKYNITLDRFTSGKKILKKIESNKITL